MKKNDQKTADAFATSWNNLPTSSVYTKEQFLDWFLPLEKKDISGKSVLELGCGNASLLTHITSWEPAKIMGVDLGDSVDSAKKIMEQGEYKNWEIKKSDLVEYNGDGADVVYCIGVLHHLQDPKKGLDSVVRNTKIGGRFHCWVYAKEGNAVIIYLVDPLRKLVNKLPWWFTKYFVATPLAVPFYLYSKMIRLMKNLSIVKKFPLYDYCVWISERGYDFHRHVAFDQLVTPQTCYIPKSTIEGWLSSYKQIDQDSKYIIFRNGNSWKFGAKLKK